MKCSECRTERGSTLTFGKVNERLMDVRKGKLEYTFGLYLNADSRRVFGREGADILEAVEKRGSIAAAARELDVSYRLAWKRLICMGEALRQPLVVTRRGTTPSARKKGGGGTTLTPVAQMLLKEFRETEQLIRLTLSKRNTPSKLDHGFQRR